MTFFCLKFLQLKKSIGETHLRNVEINSYKYNNKSNNKSYYKCNYINDLCHSL